MRWKYSEVGINKETMYVAKKKIIIIIIKQQTNKQTNTKTKWNKSPVEGNGENKIN